jgi:hypothetical protein
MNKRMLWSRILCIAGIAVIVLGCSNMSELCLLSGSGLVALSAFLGKSYHRAFVYGALGLGVIGVPAWFTFSHGNPGFWIRYLAHPLPLVYGLGLLAGVTAAMLVLFESPHASMLAPGDSVSTDRWRRSRTVSLVGLVVMPIVICLFAISLIGQLEGSTIPVGFDVVLLAVSGLPALGASLAKSRHRTFLYVALLLTLCGTIAALLFNFYQDKYVWQILFVLAYLLGLTMSLLGDVLVIVDSFGGPLAV